MSVLAKGNRQGTQGEMQERKGQSILHMIASMAGSQGTQGSE